MSAMTLATLPSVLLSFTTQYLTLEDLFAHLACTNVSLSRALFSNNSLRASFEGRLLSFATAERIPSALRTHVRRLEFHSQQQFFLSRFCKDELESNWSQGFKDTLPGSMQELSFFEETLKPFPLASTLPSLIELKLQHVFLTSYGIPYESVFLRAATTSPTSQQQQLVTWPLQRLSLVCPHAYNHPLMNERHDDGDDAPEADRQHSVQLAPVLHESWFERLLPAISHYLKSLDITYSGSNFTVNTDHQLMSTLVCVLANTHLPQLEALKLEYSDTCPLSESEDEKGAASVSDKAADGAWDLDDSIPVVSSHNFSEFSTKKQRIFRKLFRNVPHLTTLSLHFFHPMIVFPAMFAESHVGLSSSTLSQKFPLKTFNYLGLLCWNSLHYLAQLNTIESFLCDFFVEEEELLSNWKGQGTSIVERHVPLDQEVTALDAATPAPAAPELISLTKPDVSYYLFLALSTWNTLKNLQLQSTNGDTNFCLVSWKNFALLQACTQLSRLQFSCFIRDDIAIETISTGSSGEDQTIGSTEEEIPREIQTLCGLIPSLQEVIVNFERAVANDNKDEDDEDEDDDVDEPEKPNLKAAEVAAVVRSTPVKKPSVSLAPNDLLSKSKLKKLGFWDGMAPANSRRDVGEESSSSSIYSLMGPSSTRSATDLSSHCILKIVEPFFQQLRGLHSLSLIFCQLESMQPLRYIAHSLVTLCLYFTTPIADVLSEATNNRATASDSLTAIEDDPNIAVFGELRNLGWLIIHGTGDRASSLTSSQIIQLGRVLDSRMIKLRNFRLEHQPAMDVNVWNQWVRPSDANHQPSSSSIQAVLFTRIGSISFRDCSNLYEEGVLAIISDFIASHSADQAAISSSTPSSLFPRLTDIDLRQVGLEEYQKTKGAVAQKLKQLRENEHDTNQYLQVRL